METTGALQLNWKLNDTTRIGNQKKPREQNDKLHCVGVYVPSSIVNSSTNTQDQSCPDVFCGQLERGEIK